MCELKCRSVMVLHWNVKKLVVITGGLPQALAAPIAHTLFLAGEATVADAQTGTVFGAYESGLRAAREVCAALFR
jgi:uncharacterized protein with NAD-binding domain and iron-sulfur cluster